MALDLPGGVFVSRYGDKGAMMAGTALVALVAVGASLSPSPMVLAILILVMGGAWAFWQLARLAYVSEVTPIEQRGRAISLVGGMNRAGTFIGPIIGGLMGREFGLETVFYVQAVAGIGAASLMFLSVRSSTGSEHLSAQGLGGRLVSTAIDHRKVFVATAFPVIALGILRQARQVFIPLWGDSIGLDVAEIGLVVGVSSLVDALMFYPVGLLMDKGGRKWAGVPCLGVLALGFLLLPATSNLLGFLLVALLTGLGNGLGSGIVMTLGADYAPEDRRGEFLGIWRLIADSGSGGGPLLVGAVISAATLGTASLVCGGIGLVGVGMMVAFVPETLQRGTSKSEPGLATPQRTDS
jgi:MFS family permease